MQPHIILVHGLGAHQDRWSFLEKYCHKQNIPTTTLNIPATLPLKEWLAIISEKHLELLKNNKDQTIYLCGESLGGLMAYRYTQTTKTNKLAGLILISPAFKSKLNFSIYEYLLIVFGSLFPVFKIKAHFSAAMCTSDTKYQEIMKHNKKETRTFSTRLFLSIAWQQILSRLDTARWATRRSSLPVLFLLAGLDVMVDTATSQKIFNKIEAKHCLRRANDKNQNRCIIYPNMRHALSIEKQRNIVFKDIVEWIKQLS